MEGKRKHSRRSLTDQEILERWVQITYFKQGALHQDRRNLWKGTLIIIFFANPFVTLVPLIAWSGIIPPGYLALLPGINAVFSILIALSFHMASKKLDGSSSSGSERSVYFLRTWSYSYLSWVALWISFTVLLASIGVFGRIPKAPWSVLLVVYVGGGIGLWAGRKAILRAVIEGSKAHPWLGPIRLFLSLSLGSCVFLSSINYAFFRWLNENKLDTLGLLLLTIQTLGLSLLLLGLAMLAGMVAYLHYQKWRGAEKLRV